MNDVIPLKNLMNKIVFLRGYKVMLDSDLAELYGVETKRLTEQVKRNPERFPKDFMYQLTNKEFTILKSQFATSSWGGRRYPPYAFTEQGIAMLSSVLHSKRAINVNIAIMRAFVKLRKLLLTNKELNSKLQEIESKYDKQFRIVFEVLQQLVETPDKPRKEIGFKNKES
ncbi:MAG: ORF6N domain-containing protein [Candidatus Tenebribacter burtonii]|jgi:phage regulator Rha-like protein|nr:ORF6N domain-containing protein [Candidatus Tenebribacter burtonii]